MQRIFDVIESHDWEVLLDHVDDKTLFVFDLDNNIIETAQVLGSDQWFRQYYQMKVKEGLPQDYALTETLEIYDKAHHLSEVKLTDPKLRTVLRCLLDLNSEMIGLTTRGARISEPTRRQLESQGIVFNQHGFTDELTSLDTFNGVFFAHGIIFANGRDKGSCLKKLLQTRESWPKKIVFMDDHHKHVESVMKAMNEINIDCIGIRFCLLDFKQKHVEHHIADIQIYAMNNLLTDEEAEIVHHHRERQKKYGNRHRARSI